jgi:succinate dehydrogenase hydrophobic anchor subunit
MTIFIANVSTLILLNISLFSHIHVGIKEILIDYVHHEITRNWILILLRVFCLIIIKYVSFFFVFKNNLIIQKNGSQSLSIQAKT